MVDKTAESRLGRRTYSIEEVGEMLGLSRDRTYRAARADALPVPVIRVGKRMFVAREAFDRVLGEGEAAERASNEAA